MSVGFMMANTSGGLVVKSFAKCTPAEIQTVSRSGKASEYWEIGDRHKIVLNTGETIYVKIADFNHDAGTDGKTLPLTLIMENCFNTTQQLKSTNSNLGGWGSCTFRTSTLSGIKSSFPAEWQAIMTTARKKTSAGNQSSTIVTTDDALWLLSEVEVVGTDHSGSFNGEGTVYPIFSDSASRVARVNNEAASWWTRSPYTANSMAFMTINAAGAYVAGLASAQSGIRLGFCVG